MFDRLRSNQDRLADTITRFAGNIEAEIRVRAIAKHVGVDMAAVNRAIRAEIARADQQLATRA